MKTLDYIDSTSAPDVVEVIKTRQNAEVVREQSEIALLNFLQTEIQLGLEFAERAADYRSKGRASDSDRNLKVAQTALVTILSFLPKAGLTPSEEPEISQDVARLKASLN